MKFVFLLGYPQAPTRSPLGKLWGARGGVEINKQLKIVLYINSRVFKSEDIMKEVSFAFRINSDPPRAGLGVIIVGDPDRGAET